MIDSVKSYTHSQHTFLGVDLYDQVNPKKWGITDKLIRKEKFRTKKILCAAVFAYFIYLVILDMIENNITFEFPLTGKNKAYIYVKPYQDEAFLKLFSKGAFSGIDFLASQYKAYQLTLQWFRGRFIREKPIYISANLKNWFYSKINSGKVYY